MNGHHKDLQAVCKYWHDIKSGLSYGRQQRVGRVGARVRLRISLVTKIICSHCLNFWDKCIFPLSFCFILDNCPTHIMLHSPSKDINLWSYRALKSSLSLVILFTSFLSPRPLTIMRRRCSIHEDLFYVVASQEQTYESCRLVMICEGATYNRWSTSVWPWLLFKHSKWHFIFSPKTSLALASHRG